MEKVGDVANCHGCIRGLPLVNEEDRPDEGKFRSLLSLIREAALVLSLVGASTNSCRGCALPWASRAGGLSHVRSFQPVPSFRILGGV